MVIIISAIVLVISSAIFIHGVRESSEGAAITGGFGFLCSLFIGFLLFGLIVCNKIEKQTINPEEVVFSKTFVYVIYRYEEQNVTFQTQDPFIFQKIKEGGKPYILVEKILNSYGGFVRSSAKLYVDSPSLEKSEK